MNSIKTVLFILLLLIGSILNKNTQSYLKVHQSQQNNINQITQNQPLEEGQNQDLDVNKVEAQNQLTSKTQKQSENDVQTNQSQSTVLEKEQTEQRDSGSQLQSQPQSKPQAQLSNNTQNLFLFSPRNIELKTGQIKNYNYKFEDIGLQGDLYFIGFSRDQKPQQSPNIKVKLNNTELNCIKKPTDVVCVIPKSDFKANDTFNVQITCTNYCEITVQVYMNSQINLQMGNYTQIQFHMDAAGVIVNSKLPQNTKQFTQVNIIATIDNSYEVKDGFKMKAAVGPQLDTSNVQYKYQSTSIWDDGQGIFLTKDQINTGDSIKIIIIGPKFLKLTLQVFYKNNDTRSIYLDEDVYDDAKNTTKYYEIDISGQQNINTSGLYFKLIRYSGISELTIFTDNTKSKQITFGSDQTTNNHFVLSPEQRKSQNLSDKFTIAVSSSGVATYKLLVELDNKGYTYIQNGQAEFGIIEKNQVDNFVFQVQHIPSTNNNNKTITLSAKALQGNVSILVTRCGSLEVNNTYDCIYNTTDEVKNSNKFNEIIGTYHQYPEDNTFHFTFSYDTSLCPSKEGLKIVHNCVFLFVLQSQGQRARYELVIGQISQDYKILEEGIPMRDRLFQLNYNYYRLTLSNNDNVVGVNFFLSTISGDAVILGSTTVKFPQLPKDSRFDQPQVKSHAYFIDFNESADTYYVSVFAYDTSYYALTASVIRKDSNNKTIVSELTLLQNIPSINFIDQNDQQLKFYIEKFVGTSFFIDIQQIVGYTWFRVKRADDNWQVIAEQQFKQSDSWIEVTQKQPTKPTNYIVIVQSSQGVFQIQYSRKGGCVVHRFSKPVFIMLDVNTTRCYSYQITIIDNIDISTSIGNYQGGINNVNITIDINGTTFQLNQSSMSIPSTKWIEYCPNLALQDNKNITTCFMKVYASSYIDIYYNFVVQYENQEIYLIDGVYQRTNTQLSKTVSKHYYFIVDWENTITVFLKSFTNSNYQINARIVSWRQYLTMTQQSVYPLFDFNNDISSNTSSLQTTSLIITRATLDKYQCNYNCVLLISVFSTSQSLTNVSYDIEVSQLRGYLFSGDAKLGFVEAGNSQIYEIKTSLISQEAQLLLKVQPLTEDCAITTLNYRLEAKEQFQEQGLQLTNNSYIIPAHLQDRVYSVQINTKTTCAFQISLLSSDSFVTLIPGISFDVIFNSLRPQYYLYRHKFNESLNILTMMQYGNLNIEATPLTSEQQANISQLVVQNIQFKFKQSSNVGYLQIQTSDKDFCVHCYYLIKLTPLDNSSLDLVVFPSGTPIQVRSNRIINQKIHIGQDKKIYRYNSQQTFYINLDFSIGQASIKVIRLLDKRVIINYNVSGSEIINVYANSSLQELKNNEKSGWDVFGEVYLYQIVITPTSNNSAVAYSLVFKNSTDPLRLRQGIPFTINVRDRNKCITFPSLESNKSAYLIISMQDTNKMAYVINCSQTVNNKTSDCAKGSNILIKEVRTPQSISSEIRQFNGTYSFCVTIMKLTSFTVLLSRNNMIHLQPDKPLFIESTNDIQTFDIYNPNLENVMIEVYECKGKVALLTTSNYTQLQKSRNADSKVVLQRSKTAGHFISNYEPYQGEEILDLFTSVIPQNNSLASYIIKYTHYNKDNPYQSIQPDSLDVRYDLTEDEIIFKVDRIVNYGGYQSIQNNNYTILISSDASNLLNIANCEINKADIQASYLLDSDPSNNTNAEFAIPLQSFKNLYGQNHFYATAIAVVGSSGFSKSKHRHSYKIIYNIAQINLNYRANMDKSGVELKIIFVWVVLPTIIVLIIIFIAFRHCIKGMRYNPIQDAVHLVQQNPNMSLDTKKNYDMYPSTQTVLVAPKSLSQVEQSNENNTAQSDLRQ